MQPHKADDLSPTFGRSHRADHGSRSDRNIQAVFSWTVSLCVRRSAVGSSLALSATGSRARAVRATASCPDTRSEEHTSELQSLMRISYAVFCLKKKKKTHATK